MVDTPHNRALAPDEVRFDRGRSHRARLGFVLLAMEQTVERDVFTLLPPGVAAHFSRVRAANTISVETLDAMAPLIGEAAVLILPDESLDTLCYACTSGSVIIGENRVFDQLRRRRNTAHITSLITSVMRALKAVNAKRIAVATPYIEAINVIEKTYMEANGFEITNIQGLGIEQDADMARITPSYLKSFAEHVDRKDADAIFISCSALRSIEIIETLESTVKKPVVVSNQAMMWDCLRLAGIPDIISGYGALMRTY